jgi:hypothetical protein
VIDLVISNATSITVYFNTKQFKQSDFCDSSLNGNVSFSSSGSQIYVNLPTSTVIKEGILQIKDINIDGYPDFMVVVQNPETKNESVLIIINTCCDGTSSSSQYVLPVANFQGVQSASFIDYLENGIIDFFVSTTSGSYAFYNNYLQQNFFFIKGFGAGGNGGPQGSQIVGASFYWVNSVGESFRTTYQPQIIQTAYSALQTPFSYCGLGRANNYVESFTLGTFGQFNSWSPIIPNSQLAVYTNSEPSKYSLFNVDGLSESMCSQNNP